MTKTREEILRDKVAYEQRRRERMKNEDIAAYRAKRALEAKRGREKLKARDPEEVKRRDRKKYDSQNIAALERRAAYMEKWRAAHPEKREQYKQARGVRDPGWFLIPNAKRRAAKMGVPFDLVEGDFEVPEVCPVLGIRLSKEPATGAGGPRPDAPSLDRLIPALGYVRGNVYVVSFRANMVKNEGSAAEHEAVAAYMRARGAT